MIKSFLSRLSALFCFLPRLLAGSRMMQTVSRMIQTISRMMQTVSRIMKTVSRIMQTVSRIMQTVGRIMQTVSRIMQTVQQEPFFMDGSLARKQVTVLTEACQKPNLTTVSARSEIFIIWSGLLNPPSQKS